MDNHLWQLGNEFRGQTKASEDQQWSVITSKLAEYTRSKGDRMNNLDLSKNNGEPRLWDKFEFQEVNKYEGFNLNNLMNVELKVKEALAKSPFRTPAYNMNTIYQNNNANSINSFKTNAGISKFSNNSNSKEVNGNNNGSNNNNSNKNDNSSSNNNAAVDKRFKTLPLSEMLPRNEVLGGYIFVCNNDTMQEDLKRQLFGLPPRYRDSVRAITPGLPLFLYNYTTHQLHGIFEVPFMVPTLYGWLRQGEGAAYILLAGKAASFGGSNIDPTAWEDKKCKGESRFPAQVRIRVRKLCKALEEDEFRPVLHHYDGPKFRLELSIKETLDLLDLCEKAGN